MAISFSRANPDYFTSSAGISLPNADWCIALAVRITGNEGTERQALFTCFDGNPPSVGTKQVWVRVHDTGFPSQPGRCLTRVCDGVNPEIVLASAVQLTVGAWVLGVFQRSGTAKQLWVGSFGNVPTLQASSTAALGAVVIAQTLAIGWQPNQYPLQGDMAFFARGDFALSSSELYALSRGVPPHKVTTRWSEYLPMHGPAATLRPAIGSNSYTRTGSPSMVASPFHG